MFGFYYCAGCHRRCRGSSNPCLDCDQALEILSRTGYSLGYNEGLEWGMSHPPFSNVLPSERREAPYRATQYLSQMEEDRFFTNAYERGFRRGMRSAQSAHRMFAVVLEELLLDIGRREAMVYCTSFVVTWLQRSPSMELMMDYNILKEINQFF